ncbi:MAG: radical SAM protein [Propionibacteriaceae bacterium]|jgi:pyruvate formate lyase activating enzyme|nr:radical SAM protein [Propionibacteriaceae bacterium]
MAQPYVFNIQRFSTHDGPGLRTTIFFKGCPLRCPWCHNPEAVSFEPETMADADGKTELVGRAYSVDELVAEACKDQLFYDQSGGGVTLSGGEAMAQDFAYIRELVAKLTARGVRVGVDTCGVAATERFAELAPEVDFWLYDLKFIDPDDHKSWTGADNKLVLRNLSALSDAGAAIYLRMILIDGLNTSPDQIGRAMEWLRHNAIRLRQVDLLPYHKLGRDKRRRLGLPAVEFAAPDAAQLSSIRAVVALSYPSVTIGG